MGYVLDFQEIDQTQAAVVGGKGAHLGALSRIAGLRVPAGFCVTADAFLRIMAAAPSTDDPLDRLSHLQPDGHCCPARIDHFRAPLPLLSCRTELLLPLRNNLRS